MNRQAILFLNRILFKNMEKASFLDYLGQRPRFIRPIVLKHILWISLVTPTTTMHNAMVVSAHKGDFHMESYEHHILSDLQKAAKMNWTAFSWLPLN